MSDGVQIWHCTIVPFTIMKADHYCIYLKSTSFTISSLKSVFSSKAKLAFAAINRDHWGCVLSTISACLACLLAATTLAFLCSASKLIRMIDRWFGF